MPKKHDHHPEVDPNEEIASSEYEEVQSEEQPDYEALYLRALADQENARKRASVEKEQFAKFAQTGAVLDLLPVVDNFYRATEHIPEDQKGSPWLTGIMYIQKQLIDVLTQMGVEEIAAKPGDAFNSELHEAIGTAINEEVPEDHIITIQNKGYTLHGKVIRPVQAIVSKR